MKKNQKYFTPPFKFGVRKNWFIFYFNTFKILLLVFSKVALNQNWLNVMCLKIDSKYFDNVTKDLNLKWINLKKKKNNVS